MYKLIRSVLFLFKPEAVHYIAVTAVRIACYIPGFRKLATKVFRYESKLLQTEICGLKFQNKVGLAAGFDKNADYYSDFCIFGFSFIEIGTVTPLSQAGNQKPRLFRIIRDKALINRMGFNNKGVDHAANRLRNRNHSLIVGGNIGKNTLTPNEHAAQDYAISFDKLYDFVDYFAVNISCPNIKGMEKLQDYESISGIVNEVMNIRKQKDVRKPVFLKISPDLTFAQIDEMLDLYNSSDLDGIIATNTTTTRHNLSISESEINAIGSGGMSGKPLYNKVKEIVVYICKHSSGRIPVIAVGGIMSAEDALEMIRAGAKLVQIYTGFIYEGPFLVKRINKHIDKYYRKKIA
ncbi:MAG: quinone-dependent dihydroorotate dehydrogenase [Bacteroidales bacterium]|nr:quinone-dependent dihydroorotate dehydrogenase [Bacteroidales bacterium]